MSESKINPDSEYVPAPERVTRITKVSLWMGILATFPYFCGILALLLADLFIRPASGYWALLPLRILAFPGLLGIISGFPFGLGSIIAGIVGWTRQPKELKNVVFAILGILLGIGGILGHIWFFVTCQFCQ
ncbi:MAG: hypothetical protein AB1531_05575 [Chloroflexota bacterium]